MTIEIYNSEYELSKEDGMYYLCHKHSSLMGIGKNLSECITNLFHEGVEIRGQIIENPEGWNPDFVTYIYENF